MQIGLMGEETFACPRQHIRENAYYWGWILKFYAMYRKGHLPETGAILDQSNKAIEVFQVLDGANEECDREEQERQAAKSKRNGRGG